MDGMEEPTTNPEGETQIAPEPEAPKTRKTPRQGDYRQPASRHTPSSMAIDERSRADRWKLMSMIVAVTCFILCLLVINASRATERIYVMDGNAGLYSAVLEDLSNSKGYFNTVSLHASNIILLRGPQGLDLYDMVKLFMSSSAATKLEKNVQENAQDMKRRNLQWKPIIEYIGEPVVAAKSRIVEVKGRIVQTGVYASRAFYDETPFRLVLNYDANTDLGKASAYPWVCSDFNLQFGEQKR